MLTVEDAHVVLDALGSASDPVFVRGKETTPTDLAYSEHADKSAHRFRVRYYRSCSARSLYGPVRGTLVGMIKDRLKEGT